MEALKTLAKELSNSTNSDNVRWFDLTKLQKEFCKNHDIVVVYGYSDDTVEFDGAIRAEVDAWEGAEIYVNIDGPMEPCDWEHKDCLAALKDAKKIEAFWYLDGWTWSFKTDIPHETFEFYSDGEPYCNSIVFYRKDMA